MPGALGRLELGGEGAEPGELHLGIAPGVGVARQGCQVAQRPLGKLDTEGRPVRAQETPQATQRDAEVVQRLFAVAVDQLLSSLGRPLELDERQPANRLLRRTGEQIGRDLHARPPGPAMVRALAFTAAPAAGSGSSARAGWRCPARGGR